MGVKSVLSFIGVSLIFQAQIFTCVCSMYHWLQSFLLSPSPPNLSVFQTSPKPYLIWKQGIPYLGGPETGPHLDEHWGSWHKISPPLWNPPSTSQPTVLTLAILVGLVMPITLLRLNWTSMWLCPPNVSDTVKWKTVDYIYLFCDKPFVYVAGDPEKVVSYNTPWPKQRQVELLFHLL